MRVSRRQMIQSSGQFIIALIGTFVAQLVSLATATSRFPNAFEIYLAVLISVGTAIPIVAAIFGMSKVKTEAVAGRN